MHWARVLHSHRGCIKRVIVNGFVSCNGLMIVLVSRRLVLRPVLQLDVDTPISRKAAWRG